MSGSPDRLTADHKEAELERLIGSYQSVLVAFSGGVDSSYLTYIAHRLLGERSLAVTALSPSVSLHQKELALKFAGRYQLRHEIVHTNEMEDTSYTSNPSNRCYFCKTELYSHLTRIGRERRFEVIFDGSNADDQGDFRPGHQAARERSIVSPLAEVGLTKQEIRQLSRKWDLPCWDQPAMPCLASRLPYGVEVTRKKLNRVERAEGLLREMGFRNFRVRHHEHLARIEVAPEEMPRMLDLGFLEKVNQELRSLGYHYVTLDLQGFRSGSLNEVL